MHVITDSKEDTLPDGERSNAFERHDAHSETHACSPATARWRFGRPQATTLVFEGRRVETAEDASTLNSALPR